MAAQSPVTQAALARKLGIDQSTVSRAFSQPELVAPDLRARITDAALRLGYRANRAARATRMGRTEHLLIVQGLGESVSSLHTELLSGLHNAIGGTGLHLGILRLEDQVLTDEAQLPAVLRELSADGLLLNYEVHTPAGLADIIERHRIPTVWLNVERSHDAVRPDDVQVGGMMAAHLLGLGHHRVAYADLLLHTDPNRHVSRDDRLIGYRQAMRAANLPETVLAPRTRQVEDRDAEFMRGVLAEAQPTAVVCYGHMDAAAVSLAAAWLGLRVPQDLSIVVSAEYPVCQGLPFTTAIVPLRAVGAAAVGMLIRRIAAPSEHQPSERLPCTIMKRASCATPGG